ncbi:guanylate cyclase domain-containing protein [Haematococcus lacustris]|uniref:Guanylate cyclase domain-containing protein n=1 Tax=Haematococcus lacustris TaxID=44745 RepID=A0A699ZTH0_HAELA|nr:guanylate cyclase domain-containing protein [Haematococcus lacustris]
MEAQATHAGTRHEVQAHLVPHPLGLAGSGGGCAQLLVLVQHDVTQYIEAQLEVKKRVLPAPGAGSWGSSKEPSSARADLDAAAAASNSSMARHHKAVTVLFADIRGFTTMCNTLPPEEVMMFLNGMFTAFDALVRH